MLGQVGYSAHEPTQAPDFAEQHFLRGIEAGHT
jgi:hypothetical protein